MFVVTVICTKIYQSLTALLKYNSDISCVFLIGRALCTTDLFMSVLCSTRKIHEQVLVSPKR